ncbi:MAG: beta-ketoacyl synthase N-terminal-like domain-containing protein [Actinophytocola sp.]|uniref:beta-ketoacyl synthase N-terminal-like domain-containing protein n=1 Tax=Actinophytocola sp. TaxID=1872138 RepID=UPI003C707F7C
MNNERIAIVGVGLRYPDAVSPEELWENVLAGREAFRQPAREPGRSHASPAEVGSDAGHRLAMDTAAAALADAGFPGADGLPPATTGVLLTDGEPTGDSTRSSSLQSVVSAAEVLADGDLDVAIAGGAQDEGCGVVVLMREADALARRRRIYASITGWGVCAGHRLALARAYERARYCVATVSYFEGHDTGTAVEELAAARRAADPAAPPAALGTLSGNVGRPRASAGVAGLIKAALAVHHQVIPPVTGRHPRPVQAGRDAPVYVPDDAALWPAGLPVRAGVSATGLGGTTSHLALEEAPGRERRTGVGRWAAALVAGRQDTDVLLVDAHSAAELLARVARLAETAAGLSTAGITDLAGTLAIQQRGGAFRVAVVAGDPVTATTRLSLAADALADGRTTLLSPADGVFLAHRTRAPRIAYLFPGHGAGPGRGGALRRRFPVAEHLFGMAPDGDHLGADLVVAGSLAGLRVLHALGVDADIAVGHGIGELTALSWSGALDGGDLIRIAGSRGRADGATGVVFCEPRRPVVSTVTGGRLAANADPCASQDRAADEPMRFQEEAVDAVAGADLAIEVGPGRALSAHVARVAPGTPVLACDTDSASLSPLLAAVGAAYALGAAVDPTPLFADRVIRPVGEDDEPRFLPGPGRTAPEEPAVLSNNEARAATRVTTVDNVPDQVSITVLSGRED